MSKNTMPMENRWLSTFLHSRIGEICFSLCLVMSIAITSYFSYLKVTAQTGMDSPKMSYGMVCFYAVGSFLVSGYFVLVYVWVCFGRQVRG